VPADYPDGAAAIASATTTSTADDDQHDTWDSRYGMTRPWRPDLNHFDLLAASITDPLHGARGPHLTADPHLPTPSRFAIRSSTSGARDQRGRTSTQVEKTAVRTATGEAQAKTKTAAATTRRPRRNASNQCGQHSGDRRPTANGEIERVRVQSPT